MKEWIDLREGLFKPEPTRMSERKLTPPRVTRIGPSNSSTAWIRSKHRSLAENEMAGARPTNRELTPITRGSRPIRRVWFPEMTNTRWQPANVWELSRHIVAVGLSGIITGLLVGGVGGRLFMRVAAATAVPTAQGRLTEAGFRVGEITADGSIGLILFIGLFTGFLGAVVLVIFYPWLSWAGRWRGIAFGGVLFAVGSATSDIQNPDNIDFRILDNPFVTVPLIVVLFLMFGVAISYGTALFERRLPAATTPTTEIAFPLMAGLGVLGGISLLPVMFTDNLCNCQPPRVAVRFVLVTMAGTLLWWISTIRNNAKLTRIASSLGVAGLIGATGFGLIRAVSDSVAILLQ